ncbi:MULTISPECIES: DMT family transporter [Pseudomonas chlororaphis group]|uniref:DMT family transporter n=1 Tax=Pseudomonas chlororaphis group TaxID=136842 RepID=UPI002097E69F|nr:MULTISPECIES: DMT family transporter [Pseudomonas chlororaphis group]MCO7578814.1 DMT family transporter [Pseudomonas protegens]MCO7584615.1 DMT family transporter [Pseudomonas chlororaphis]MCO7601900.1 DMT family transporter [Pseudomonas chlororaphis]
MTLGLLAAISATFSWSLLYVFPTLVGDYSLFDLAVVSYAFAGLGSLLVLVVYRNEVRQLRLKDWGCAALLGFLGYIGYFFLITTAVLAAGPVIPPVMMGSVPIVLAIAGNMRSSSVPWRAIAGPLMVAALGISLVNLSVFDFNSATAVRPTTSILFGLFATLLAIGFWTGFGLLNESALAQRPSISPMLWSAMLIFMCSVEMLAFIPVGLYLKLSHFASHPSGLAGTQSLIVCGLIQGLGATLAGAWAWSIASRRLPLALSGQLIASGTIYATTMGLFINQRWPTPMEALGTGLLLVGVVWAIHAFYRRRTPLETHGGIADLSQT